LPWWKAIGYGFSIRLGKFVEFEKGKDVIVVPSLDKLPAVIDQLIAAVRAGELDNQIAAASVRHRRRWLSNLALVPLGQGTAEGTLAPRRRPFFLS
jgi:hypothetical protein